ncbi:hypothetical protein KY284_004808 [Solanum tuberosum]|nr:hypothetical protein KY284_004808 [Solanum tuberosum]
MDSEERRRFSGKIYTRRNGKTPKKDASTAMATADVTRVSETLDGEQSVKVVPKTDHLITNSGDVPEGGVELKEDGNCSGEEVVRISLNASKSAEIRILGVESELRIPKANQCYNPPVCGIVEREKRIPKVNQYYNSSDYLLGKDKLPSEIYKKSQKNKNEMKNKGFALNRNREDLPTCRNARHLIPFVDALRQGRILERGKSITGSAEPSSKRDMTSEKIGKLNRGLENLPKEELGAVAEMIKKRGVPYKQNNGELELDINNIDAETMWELNRFVTNYYNKRSKSKATSSSSKVATALKEGTTGKSFCRF